MQTDRNELVVCGSSLQQCQRKLCSVLGFRRELSKELAKLAVRWGWGKGGASPSCVGNLEVGRCVTANKALQGL